MKTCATCGNNYSKTFEVIINQQNYVFDCFECAIHKLAPSCKQCGCKIIGHGVEAKNNYYCCAHCAKQAGIHNICDHG